jgi:hypothetical protein
MILVRLDAPRTAMRLPISLIPPGRLDPGHLETAVGETTASATMPMG